MWTLIKELFSLLGLPALIGQFFHDRGERQVGKVMQQQYESQAVDKQVEVARENENANAALSDDDIVAKLRSEYGIK